MAEKLKIPNEVIDEDWKQDIGIDYETFGKNAKQEMEYESPSEIDQKTIEELKKIDLRPRFRELGRTARTALFTSEKLAA